MPSVKQQTEIVTWFYTSNNNFKSAQAYNSMKTELESEIMSITSACGKFVHVENTINL